ncbi:hypothetical protein C0J52_11744 [Blattella germanica]|nr:hypothetical protein C0J52_11744 [Blattella germanica]
MNYIHKPEMTSKIKNLEKDVDKAREQLKKVETLTKFLHGLIDGNLGQKTLNSDGMWL